jgi:conjugative transfer signal peptidase TraF
VNRVELAWLGTTVVVLGAIATIPVRLEPLLVWNVSPSAPVGLYRVLPGSEPSLGRMALARAPQGWRDLAARRGYIPANVPLVKRAAAVAGSRVCSGSRTITIDARFAARRLARDRRGRPLPAWHGCIILKAGEVFLLGDRPDSFDGRYFGVTRPAELIGTARLLWRR